MEHSKEFEKLVADIMPNIKEISVAETLKKVSGGTTLIDVREDNEFDAEHAKSATHIGRGVIERDIVHKFPDKNTELILYCGGGFRSALAADNLQKMGYKNILSMAGGWTAWKEKNAPTEN
ncbi:MAG: rhodanese-like domain-containing protein [Pyrinomonadaceae bacterium]